MISFRLKTLAIIIVLVLCSLKARAQCTTCPSDNQNSCKTIDPSYTDNGEQLYIRIVPHVIRKSDGTGGLTVQQIEESIRLLRSDFDKHDIYFVWDCNIVYHDDDTHYTVDGQTPFNEGWEDADAINMFYYPAQLTYQNGAEFAPNNIFFTQGTAPDNNMLSGLTRTISHEMGHCLGLCHTFHEHNSCEENVTRNPSDGSQYNCECTGDKLCDTPADPKIEYGDIDPLTCQPYTSLGNDGFGDPYNPDIRNIMSYSHLDCRDQFSFGQVDRMRKFILNSPVLIPTLVTDEIIINNDQTWNSGNTPSDHVKGRVTIKSGSTLIIASDLTLQMNVAGRFYVEPGAELHVYGTLTNKCISRWQGIRVMVDPSKSTQFKDPSIPMADYPQGYVKVDGGTIENAERAIRLDDEDLAEGGGILSAKNSTFRNNRIGISLESFENIYIYPGPLNNNTFDYNANIIDCTFENNANYLSPKNFAHFIVNRATDGVEVIGTTFKNNNYTPDAPSGPTAYGEGIRMVQASMKIRAQCLNATLSGCGSLVPCEFENLGTGIFMQDAPGIAAPGASIIQECEFRDNYTGLDNRGISMTAIYNNKFYLDDVPDPSLSAVQAGVHLLSVKTADGLIFENNTFTGDAQNSLFTFGVIADNLLATHETMIRRCTFDELNIGIQALRNNGNFDYQLPSGLQFECNDFEAIQSRDFDVPPFFNVSNTSYVRPVQGTQNTTSNDPSLNIFSRSGQSAFRDFNNSYQPTPIRYYHKSGLIADEPLIFSNLNKISSNAINNCTNNYPSRLNAPQEKPGNGFSTEEHKSRYNYHYDNFNASSAEDDFSSARYHRQEYLDALKMLKWLSMTQDSLVVDQPLYEYVMDREEPLTRDIQNLHRALEQSNSAAISEILLSIVQRENMKTQENFNMFLDRIKDPYVSIATLLSEKSRNSIFETAYHYWLHGQDHPIHWNYVLPEELESRSQDSPASSFEVSDAVIYPNPSITGQYYFHFDKPIDAVEIFDIHGKMINFTRSFSDSLMNIKLALNVPSGIYILQIKQGAESTIYKLLK